ncbi:hypothetical protein CO131_02245 [Candidatus Kaiserbacteria bacterium CG_4_9_14_3_um_filter_50_16]|uniref:Uncharacterized protein n=1 Tax=Candidatus Kaiserbacteria bacterium CG08_land_8_20_14_0_20_50_21 TaxID=1974604 RepID=A0A2H0YXY2_9BACT|nr:MAG: hypothetical protein COT23_01805 [Candidatus Kaiserbacteria bacterium CG08_land_8_20_14_0_20_50_21]PIU82270.1 MAG: hypothetical protein COS69_00350 [Candidatus Kaiserbacteria bacterium CG06_land_8_20_14_3_00_49_31]PIW96351.1 MAG: hypothetical protein COZ83_01355 [Candidatus Kaiserbacteria bacterium CG_4_8_14_3_um_filter_50_23]PJA00756.1 MAG: hypothetical protein COX76_01060 [Candidatus Kaiserbacteria bacterium CG_4_10_14_0_2_um_filter_50_16]PJA94234.1 MAG: hypothetical protein CO131_022
MSAGVLVIQLALQQLLLSEALMNVQEQVCVSEHMFPFSAEHVVKSVCVGVGVGVGIGVGVGTVICAVEGVFLGFGKKVGGDFVLLVFLQSWVQLLNNRSCGWHTLSPHLFAS